MSTVRTAGGAVCAVASSVESPRRRSRRAFAAALFVAFFAAVPLGRAHAEGATPRETTRRPLVTLAEVGSRVEAGTSLPNVTELLKTDAEAELAAIDWATVGVRKPYLVSASVTHLEARRDDGALRAICTVSVTIREAQSGTILAVVEGRARSESGSARPSRDEAAVEAERGALSGAVHGAVSAIASAIRRASD
jgi:hypothetical protein